MQEEASLTRQLLEHLTTYKMKQILTTSACLFAFAIGFGFLGFPKLLEFALKSQVVLMPGTEIRQLWEKAPFAVTFKIYVFNITNPEQVVNGGKPHVQQIGPYIFDEWKEKYDLEDNDENDSVSFDMKNTFIFRPDLTKRASGLRGDERVTIPHLLIMGGLIAIQRDSEPLLPTAIDALTQIFRPQSPFLTASVMDILFNGIPIDCAVDDFTARSLCSRLEDEKPIRIVNDTHLAFSLFSGANGTTLGRFVVNRGKKVSAKLGEVMAFNGEEEVDAWHGDCNKILGTDSTIFAPFHEKQDILYAFAPDLCRSLGAKYYHPSSYRGIPTGYYSIELGDMKADPSQHCFCRDQDVDKCPPSGTLDLYPCTGAPLIISKPQFLDADEELVGKIGGLTPNRTEHDIFLHMEMLTSSPLSAAKRLQFSLEIEPVPKFELMAKLPHVIIPVMWVEESAHLNSTYTDLFSTLYTVITIVEAFKLSALTFGFGCIALAVYKTFIEQFGRKVKVDAVQPTAPPSPDVSIASERDNSAGNQKY